MTIIQKVVVPGRERAWQLGDNLVAGYAVSAPDVAWATTPRELFDAYGLGFPGSPYRADSPYVDVIRFTVTPTMRFVAATGGSTLGGGSPIGEGFVDHPPFTGSGFTASADGRLVPLWWMEAERLPPSSELWRMTPDGRETLLAAYIDVAQGWVSFVPTESADGTGAFAPSDLTGLFGEWRAARVLADPKGDGTVAILSWTRLDGLQQDARGLWVGTVPAAEVGRLHGMRFTARWRGLPFQLIRRVSTAEGEALRMLYIGRDVRRAEAAGLQQMDAGVYEATAPRAELEDVEGIELTPRV